MNDEEHVLSVEIKDRVCLLTLDRPERRNAISDQLRMELSEAVLDADADADVSVIAITGRGDKAFCAGADLSEFLTAPTPTIARQVRWERDIWGVFLNVPQPIIVALHGYVLGSGVEMSLCSDLRNE